MTHLEEIDSQEKAYVLGLYYADGTTGANMIASTINDDHLYKISNYFDWPIREYGPVKSRYSDNGYITLRLTKEIINLNKHLGENKEMFPLHDINNDLIWHFIRGLFDGDGCIAIDKRYADKYSRIEKDNAIPGDFYILINDYDHAILLRDFIANDCKINKTKITPIKRRGRVVNYKIRWGGTSNIIAIRNKLYEKANLYLTRKQEKFDLIRCGNRSVAGMMGKNASHQNRLKSIKQGINV